MNLQNLGLGLLGLFLIYLSIKSFILYGRGGAFGIDFSKPFEPGSFTHKPQGEKSEEILLLRNAIGMLIIGLALCYVGFSSVLYR